MAEPKAARSGLASDQATAWLKNRQGMINMPKQLIFKNSFIQKSNYWKSPENGCGRQNNSN